MIESSSNCRRLAFVGQAALHLAGVSILAAATAAYFVPGIGWEAGVWAWHQGGVIDAIMGEVAVHVSLCVIVWAVIVASLQRVRRAIGEYRDTETPRLTLTSGRGAVLTETLVILPIALLLIMGIAQLALVNIAATLSDLAAIEAARSVWVWAPEAQEGRYNVDRTLVAEKARVQAAAVMAPTASADFGQFASGNYANYGGTFRKMMAAMYGAQLDGGGNDVGAFSTGQAESDLSGGQAAIGENMAFNLALDSSDFPKRTARKFFNAWATTDVELVESSNWIGAKITVHHMCLMPLVAGIFGDHQFIGGQEGYYVTLERSYTLPKQIKPNAELPRF